MKMCTSGHRSSSANGRTPNRCAVCSVMRKKAAIPRKTINANPVLDRRNVPVSTSASRHARHGGWLGRPADAGVVLVMVGPVALAQPIDQTDRIVVAEHDWFRPTGAGADKR